MRVMEGPSTSTSTVISEESNKENIPPPSPPPPPDCKSTKAKGKGKGKKKKKSPIQPKVKGASFKKNKRGSGKKRKPKRIPLTDITDLVNNSTTPTSPNEQELNDSVPALPSPSIPRRKKTPVVPSSRSLRMGFR